MGQAKKKASKAKRDAGPAAKKAGGVPRRVVLAVDIAVFAVRNGLLRVLLVGTGPGHDAGEWALPGGFVGAAEPLEAAARRELRDVPGLALDPTHLDQLRTYDAPNRDDRADRRVVRVAYLGVGPEGSATAVETGKETGAETTRWEPVAAVLSDATCLAPGHADIVRDALERLKSDLEHTAVATAFFRAEFTEAQLRAVYEAVWGAGREPGGFRLDAPNFHRTLTTLSPPIVELVPDAQAATGGRPAALYRPSVYVRAGGPAARLERPIARPRPGVAATRRLH